MTAAEEPNRPAPRRRRHLDELCALCAAGDVRRAVDLAFEHFAVVRPDAATLAVLAAAVDRSRIPNLRQRLQELRERAD